MTRRRQSGRERASAGRRRATTKPAASGSWRLLAVADALASVGRMGSASGRLIARLWADARILPEDVAGRATRALHELEARRAQLLAALDAQATSLVETVVRRLDVVSRQEVTELRRRVEALERRVEGTGADLAERVPLAAAGS